eukprot:gene28268-37187_t
MFPVQIMIRVLRPLTGGKLSGAIGGETRFPTAFIEGSICTIAGNSIPIHRETIERYGRITLPRGFETEKYKQNVLVASICGQPRGLYVVSQGLQDRFTYLFIGFHLIGPVTSAVHLPSVPVKIKMTWPSCWGCCL